MKTALAILTALLIAPLAALDAAEAAKPNIIFILADDLGWGDLGCYGHPHIRTPNLDAMAADGRLYTQFYVNSPVCSPSRAAFMTGQFPSRLRVFGALGEDGDEKGNAKFVDPAQPNLARILKEQGYATGHFGKWHLDSITDPSAPPISRYGFDESRAHVATGPSFDELEKKLPWGEGKNARSSEWIMSASLDFLERNKQGPVFINIWFMVPHASLSPSKEQREGYKEFRSNGRLHDAGLRKGVGADVSTPQEIYYPSVTEMDAQIGRLIQKLKEMGTYENTILVFSSDNGPETIHISKAMHSGVGSTGLFRGQKRSLYDGGIRVPFIISWPKGGIPRGTVDRALTVSGVDLLPSLLGLANVAVPQEFKGDGEDLSKAFLGQSFAREKALFWEQRGGQTGSPLQFSPRLAMREGPWKLLMNPDGSRLELYDLQKHMMETDNLASEFPEVAQRMKASLEEWRKTLPEPNEHFSEMKPSGWETLLSGGKLRKGKTPEPDSAPSKKGEDTKRKRKVKAN
ncbi:MAG: Arylsulfatase [Verrucomicrobiota bacterium]